MKNRKSKLAAKSISKSDKPGANDTSAALADKQPESPLVEIVPKPEKLRQAAVDVNHRFGKSSGST